MRTAGGIGVGDLIIIALVGFLLIMASTNRHIPRP